MDPSSEIPPDVSNSPTSEPQICRQEERMNIPSTSTSKTIPIMSLKSETIGEQNAVLDNQYVLSSAGRKALDSIQSICSSVQLLCSKVTEYNLSLRDYKVEFEMLTKNPGLETLPDEELVKLLNSLMSTIKKILEEKTNINSHIVEIQEALEAISGKNDLPFDEDPESMDRLLTLLGKSFNSIHEEQKAQTSLVVEMKSLSVTISNKLHLKSSAVEKLLCKLQSKNEFIENMSVRMSRSIILALMVRLLDELRTSAIYCD